MDLKYRGFFLTVSGENETITNLNDRIQEKNQEIIRMNRSMNEAAGEVLSRLDKIEELLEERNRRLEEPPR